MLPVQVARVVALAMEEEVRLVDDILKTRNEEAVRPLAVAKEAGSSSALVAMAVVVATWTRHLSL